jgi:hypothetical protein
MSAQKNRIRKSMPKNRQLAEHKNITHERAEHDARQNVPDDELVLVTAEASISSPRAGIGGLAFS